MGGSDTVRQARIVIQASLSVNVAARLWSEDRFTYINVLVMFRRKMQQGRAT
jgi:hypothetical protein